MFMKLKLRTKCRDLPKRPEIGISMILEVLDVSVMLTMLGQQTVHPKPVKSVFTIWFGVTRGYRIPAATFFTLRTSYGQMHHRPLCLVLGSGGL